MKLYLLFLKKELRKLRSVFLYYWFFLALVVASVFVFEMPSLLRAETIMTGIVPLAFVSHPVILWYLLRNERTTNTHYQSFSLPVYRFPAVITQFLGVLSMAVVFLLAVTLGMWIFYRTAPETHRILMNTLKNSLNERPVHAFWFSYLMMSTVVLAEMIRYCIQRGREAVYAVSLVTCLYLFMYKIPLVLLRSDLWPGFSIYIFREI